MKFIIYQNHTVRDHSGLINAVGWEKAGIENPDISLSRMMSFDSDLIKPEHLRLYKPVASVEVNSVSGEIFSELEAVFSASNCRGHEKDIYINYGRAHSLSVGDIVKDETGKYWVVADCGFDPLEDE